MRFTLLALALTACSPHLPTTPAAPDDPPETVLVTYHARAGREAELERALEEHWRLVRRLGLVRPTPALLLRGDDEPTGTRFVNVITWTSHAAPDHAPPEVQAMWGRLQELTEARGGHPGIELPEVTNLRLD